ncbi:MAG: prephenate dehydratase [Rikenellaceae bacterium]|nr:prephenate dehydratase [Rikenellaceae bacterium]
MKQVTIQGIAGCFHETAAHRFFDRDEIEVIECDTFAVLFDRLAADPALLGVAAIENTIAGSLLQNLELLRQSNLKIIGEEKIRISHVLCALPGESLDTIEEVRSHPIALMQCGDFLKKLPAARIVERDDTAGSAREIQQGGLRHTAAICGADAAAMYGLEILAPAIETNRHNFTRFLVLADESQAEVDTAQANKASFLFTLPHTQGSLSKILTVLSFYDINLTKIQSMPIIGREWEYRFYIDVTFDNYTRYRQSVEAVRPLTSDFTILGEYRECPNPEI